MQLAWNNLPTPYAQPTPVYQKVFAREIRKQIIDEERDCVIVITGKQGKGKTTSAVSLGARVFPDQFTPDNFKQFYVFASTTGLSDNLAMNCPIGTPLISDEMAISARKGDFQKAFAKKLNDLLNIKRTQRRFVIFVLPLLPETLKDVRTKIDYLVEILDRNNSGNFYDAYVSSIDINTFDGKLHRVRPRWKTQESINWEKSIFGLPLLKFPRFTKFTKIRIQGISPEWRAALKAIHDPQRAALIQSTAQDITDEIDVDKKVQNAIEAVVANPQFYLTHYGKNGERVKFDREIISQRLGLSSHRTNKVMAILKREHKDILENAH